MKYRLMTENDLEYVVEKIMNTTTMSKAAAGPMKKPIREFIRYSQWKIPDVNCGIASMCFVLKKQQKYSIIFLFLTWLKHL